MSEFLPGVGPVYSQDQAVHLKPPAEAAIPAKPLPVLTPEQIRAVDAALASDEESQAVAALMGMWTGSMLLHDLAQEHFHVPADEEIEPRLKKKPEQLE